MDSGFRGKRTGIISFFYELGFVQPLIADLEDRSKIQNPKSKIRTDLSVAAEQFGLGLSDVQLDRFEQYAALLEEWNARLNLTRVPPEEVVPLHFLDSLTVCKAADLSTSLRLIDVGTGAGFPGLPLKIAFPALDVTLLDATRKRLDFLDAVIQELELSAVQTLHARAEDAARLPAYRERYHLVTARAVSRLNVLSEWLLPFVKLGGLAIALKSAAADAEIEEADTAIRLLGGKLETVLELTLPETDIKRKLVVLRKVRPTPSRFPRTAAQVKAQPLGA